MACGGIQVEPAADLVEREVIAETKETNLAANDPEENEANEEAKEDTEEASEAAEEENTETTQTPQAPTHDLTVHYMDVGQADATLLQYADESGSYHILYDTGDWRGNEVTSYLRNQGIETLDLVIISHPDADHMGQLDKVMENFNVGEVWMSGNESSSQTFQRGLEAVLASDADFDEPRAGDTYDIGPLQLEVLYPNSISGKSNEESIATRFTYGNINFVFTGDAGKQDEAYMRNHFDVTADVLHLGHHGSNTSSDPDFIDAVGPEIAIYSAGAGNSYGHPSPEVVQTMEDRNIELYGTDVHGTIIVTTDGNNITVDTVSQGEIVAEAEASKEETNEQEVSEQESEEESTAPAPSGCVDINSASVEELQEIIHIGPARAEDLISLRPYGSVDDLIRISGIGDARLADIKAEKVACVQ